MLKMFHWELKWRSMLVKKSVILQNNGLHVHVFSTILSYESIPEVPTINSNMRRVKSPVRYKSQVTVLWTQTKPRETETEKQEVMGRGLVSLLLICLKRYGKVLVFQPLIAGAHKGMYKSVGRLTLCQLPQLAGLIQDWWSLPPSLFFLSLSLKAVKSC